MNMNLNKLKYSVQTSISTNTPVSIPGVARSEHRDDPPEIQREVECMEGMKTRMKNIRDITHRQATHLQQESTSKKFVFGMGGEGGEGGMNHKKEEED